MDGNRNIKVKLCWTLEIEGCEEDDPERKAIEMAVAGLSEQLEAVLAETLKTFPGVKYNFDEEDGEDWK